MIARLILYINSNILLSAVQFVLAREPLRFFLTSVSANQENIRKYFIYDQLVLFWILHSSRIHASFYKLYLCNFDEYSLFKISDLQFMHGFEFFQADHALYTPGLDENRVIGDFVHDIWICYEVHCTKLCTRQ